MKGALRSRTTHYPRTYILLQEDNELYLLFWLEHGKDNSLYLWLDDDTSNNSWEVVAVHNQPHFSGSQNVELEHKPFEVFDPHISWHPTGRIHVTGYDKQGKKGKRVISDKSNDPLSTMTSGATLPIAQMIMPTLNTDKSLKNFSKEFSSFSTQDVWKGILDSKGFNISNNGASGEGFLIVDSKLIPDRHLLGIDTSLYWKTNTPNFIGKTDLAFEQSMLYPHSFSINRGRTDITACLRIFSIELGKQYENPQHALITCFNRESIDLFQMKRTI